MKKERLSLKITDISSEAKDVIRLELQCPFGGNLPEFQAGSHIELYLKNGLIRHYSLLNSPYERHRYVIAIGLSPNSNGGSKYIHNSLRLDDILSISHPRNNFELVEANEYCFIAGGIGITPILSMIEWCIANNKKWRLYYTARNRQRAAFYEYLASLNGKVNFHFNDEKAGEFLNIDEIIKQSNEAEHIYCCGPNPLMQSVKEFDDGKGRFHFEWFNAPIAKVENEPIEGDSFELIMAKTGKTIEVKPDQSILEAIEAEGIEVPFSCRSGFCRACECAVLSGEPEHMDMILSDIERQSNFSMLICVSRSKTKTLELDI